MNYFALEEDERLNNKLELKNYKIADANNLEPIVVQEKLKFLYKTPDYITKKFTLDVRHLVSEKIFNVIKMFTTKIDTKTIFVIDSLLKESIVFYEIKTVLLDCILFKNNTKKDFSTIELQKNKIPFNTAIFQAYIDKRMVTFVRFDLAECIIRRKTLGIRFVPISFSKEME